MLALQWFHQVKRQGILVLVLSLLLSGFAVVTPVRVTNAEPMGPSIQIGSYIQFGKYYNTPILWRVIHVDEDGDPLLLADRFIALKPFDAGGSYHAGNDDRANLGSNYYPDSNLRQWLNSSSANSGVNQIDWIQNDPVFPGVGGNGYASEKGFLASGNFSVHQRGVIKPTTHKVALAGVDAGKADGGTENHGYDTTINDVVQNYDTTAYYKTVTDDVFLLSVKQLKEYVYDNRAILGDDYYQAKPTQQALENSNPFNQPLLNVNSYFNYWLSTPIAGGSSYQRIVYYDGNLYDNYTGSDLTGVRPAMKIDLSKVTITSGDGSENQPYVPMPPNAAPTDISLSASSVLENVSYGTTVGTFSASDPDVGDVPTFTLVNGNGDSDNGSFYIEESALKTNDSFNYDNKNSYSIRVQVADELGLTYEEDFTIHIEDFVEVLLDNGMVRFGDEDIDSLNNNGNLNEPRQYYYSPTETVTKALTSSHDLVDQIAVGGDGDSEWNLNGEIKSTNQDGWYGVSFDKSGYVSTGESKGYGKIVSNSYLDIAGTTLKLTREYELGQCTPFVSVKSTIQNVGNQTVTNVRYWAPVIYNDRLNGDGSPDLKQQGQLANGVFTEATSTGGYTNAVKVTDQGVNGEVYTQFLYTPDSSAYAMVDEDSSEAWDVNDNFLYYQFVEENPFTQSYTSLTNDSGSFGIFKRMNDLAGGESESFEYYFGATHTNTMSVDDMVDLLLQGAGSAAAKCVVFNSNGGSMIAAKPVVGGSTVTKPVDPTKTDYTFSGWYSDEALTTEYDFTTPVTSRVTLYAKWIAANSAPTDLTLDNASIAENAAVGTVVGDFSATDPDEVSSSGTASYTYSLAIGDGDTDNASFTIDGTSLKTAASFDYEMQNSYSIRVQVADSGSLTYEEGFTITVTNVNEAPTDIALSAASIAENAGANATVGTLSATDADAGSTFTYSLVAGTGSTDNALFNIDGTVLRVTNGLDFETATSHSILVQVADEGGLTYEKPFTITVTDVDDTAPSIPSNLSSSNVQATEFTVGWNAATDNVGVTGYEVYLNGVLVTTANTTSYTFTGLSSGTIYAVTVRAIDAAGNKSEQSSALSVSTAIVPSNFVASLVVRNSFDLSWSYPLEDRNVNYEIYVNNQLVETSKKTSATINIPRSMRGQSSYTVTVRAKFKNGTFSPFSSPLVVNIR